MDGITLENYRCFREKQTARLAPLTLLVGENSTGKTSFLALIRALWDTAFLSMAPDFREGPFDLGAFPQVVHDRGGREGHADSFVAEFDYADSRIPDQVPRGVSFHATFTDRSGVAYPVLQGFTAEDFRLEAERGKRGEYLLRHATPTSKEDIPIQQRYFRGDQTRIFPLIHFILEVEYGNTNGEPEEHRAPGAASASKGLPTRRTSGELRAAADDLYAFLWSKFEQQRPFASAPIRSRPLRTYDPIRLSRDPEGEHIPSYLAGISLRDREKWARLKAALESFGRESGLFDEISIKLLGKIEGSPFQVQIRKFGRRLKGPKRNLIDVGYGVSQALPLLTELLREDAPSMFLLQQPEVHLHPNAQAALGSLFCSLAGPERQLIVETHSDFILNRVRMDVRDKKTALEPEDVSILYFEPGELDVTIHSLGLDKDGNVLNAPPGYRDFFMAEMRRSIGI